MGPGTELHWTWTLIFWRSFLCTVWCHGEDPRWRSVKRKSKHRHVRRWLVMSVVLTQYCRTDLCQFYPALAMSPSHVSITRDFSAIFTRLFDPLQVQTLTLDLHHQTLQEKDQQNTSLFGHRVHLPYEWQQYIMHPVCWDRLRARATLRATRSGRSVKPRFTTRNTLFQRVYSEFGGLAHQCLSYFVFDFSNSLLLHVWTATARPNHTRMHARYHTRMYGFIITPHTST